MDLDDALGSPSVAHLPEEPTLGIRETVPFRGMLAHRDRLLAELVGWLDDRGIEPRGPFFLRLHVVDMAGLMDIEVGAVAQGEPGGRVVAGILPAGDHAVIEYRSRSMAANTRLWRWIESEGLEVDLSPSPVGDVFVSRTERYLTDPRSERRKKDWIVQLAFLLRPAGD